MKKILLLVICILLITGCSIGKLSDDENKKISNETSLKQDGSDDLKTIEKKVEESMSNMTLEEKIGQLFIISYRDKNQDIKYLESLLEKVKPSGFVLFNENISNYESTLNLVKQVKNSSKVPMIISIDQEGGSVQRLQAMKDYQPTYIPYMYDLGLTNDLNLAKEVGKVMALELRTIGVNVDFAPSLDIFSNPKNKVIGKRSFGVDAKTVSNMGIALASGLKENKVMPVYKHFPGHGDTTADSHYSLPVIDKTYEELKEFELIPFQDAIDSGAEVIMVGHLAVPNITSSNIPASLSKILITDILKNKMGYNGLVITDALDMGAIKDNYKQEEVISLAINAGVDLLLMPTEPEKAIDDVVLNIKNGKIDEELINEKCRKILTFKYQYLEEDNLLDASYLGKQDHKDIIDKIYK